MLKTTYITRFIFEKAQYHLSDDLGSELVLKVSYKKNTYVVQNLGLPNPAFTAEAQQIAENLLARKHQVNFASR